MNKFLTTTAVGLFLGLSPVMAQTSPPADDTQAPPAASQPSQIPEAMPDPAQPSDPAAPIPGDSSQVSPSPMQPGDDAAPPAQSSQAPQSIEPAAPSIESAAPSIEPAAPSIESAAPSIEPAAPKSADASGAQFLSKQASDDWLASSLIGQSVYNAQDEAIGDINDLVTDQSGKIVAVLIGSGGFLGLGEKDVAVRFEDLKLARDENDNVKIIADLNRETLASAPDYETLPEQKVTVGSTKDDREDVGGEKTN